VDNVSGKDGQFYLSFPEYAQGVLDSLDAVMGIGQNSYEHIDFTRNRMEIQDLMGGEVVRGYKIEQGSRNLSSMQP